jgi:hypothetical protein
MRLQATMQTIDGVAGIALTFAREAHPVLASLRSHPAANRLGKQNHSRFCALKVVPNGLSHRNTFQGVPEAGSALTRGLSIEP